MFHTLPWLAVVGHSSVLPATAINKNCTDQEPGPLKWFNVTRWYKLHFMQTDPTCSDLRYVCELLRSGFATAKCSCLILTLNHPKINKIRGTTLDEGCSKSYELMQLFGHGSASSEYDRTSTQHGPTLTSDVLDDSGWTMVDFCWFSLLIFMETNAYWFDGDLRPSLLILSPRAEDLALDLFPEARWDGPLGRMTAGDESQNGIHKVFSQKVRNMSILQN